jgi:hypothetical protein
MLIAPTLSNTCCRDLLNYEDETHRLFYKRINGNTDVAVVNLTAQLVGAPRTGLRILWVLKKKLGDGNSLYQAMTQLVLANIFSSGLRPVVVLTDLGVVWQLLWLDARPDSKTIWVGAFWDVQHAINTIKALIQQVGGIKGTVLHDIDRQYPCITSCGTGIIYEARWAHALWASKQIK